MGDDSRGAVPAHQCGTGGVCQWLARRKVLVHEMSAVRPWPVDVLCVDKTGTITQPDMSVREVVYLDQDLFPASMVEDIFNAYYRANGYGQRYSYGHGSAF